MSSIALFLILAGALWRLDHVALLRRRSTIGALYWIHRLPPLPYKLAAQIVLVLFFLWQVRSFGILLAIIFAVFWVPNPARARVTPVVAIVLAVLYPFYFSKMFVIPVFGVWPDVATGVYMLVFVMMAVGLNIVVGYAGLLDLGYVAFYATGAYTAAWFTSLQFPNRTWHFGAVGITPDLPGIHVSVFPLLVIAGALTALFGILIGLPTLRLRGDYLAIVTLGFGEILPQIARNGDNFLGTGFNLTNGPNGITPLDAPGFGNQLSDLTHGFLPANYLTCCTRTMFGHQITSTDVFYWTAIVLLLFTVFCSFRLQFSRLGRAWIAIREDETAAAAMGVPLMRTKTWAYASGAFFGGIAGAYYASFKSATFPGDFYFNISVFILCMVILGGMGNIWGVIVGGAFLAYLNQEGLANTGQWLNTNISFIGDLQLPGSTQPGLDVPLFASGIYGLIILLVMLFRPEGLIPSRRVARGDARRRARRAALRRHARGDRVVSETQVALRRPSTTDNVLVATDVRKEFGGLIAVNDVNFTVPRGKVISLIGPNGAGKTTFFNMLTGVYTPTSGQIVVPRRGRHRQAAARDHRARHRPHVPEHPPLPEHDGARERARRHALAHEGEPLQLDPPHARRCGARNARRATRRASCSSTPASGASRRRSRAACRTATSAGSRWRARSRREPKLLLLDEPTAGMNPQESAEFTAFLSQAARRGRADRADDRARHARRHGRLRPRLGARLRREDRRRRAARGAEERARDRGVSRQGRRRGHETAGPLSAKRERREREDARARAAATCTPTTARSMR